MLGVSMTGEVSVVRQRKGYAQASFWEVERKYLRDQTERKGRCSKWGCCWNAWSVRGPFVGSAIETPASDGKLLHAGTGYSDVFCYDLEGKRIRCNWFGPQGASRGSHIASPLRSGERLPGMGGVDGTALELSRTRGWA